MTFDMSGESPSIDRQVSPGKLYRAAILKKRFADTILKAREKTLSQVSYMTALDATGSFQYYSV